MPKIKKPTKPQRARPGAYVGFRAPADLKEKIERAAAEANRSQSSEAQFRLERSFSDQALLDQVLGPAQYRQVALAAVANFVVTGERYARLHQIEGDWLNNQLALYAAISSAIRALLENFPNDEDGNKFREQALASNSRVFEQKKVGS